MKQINVCRDCKNRKIGCHAECKKYLEAKAEYEAEKQIKKEFDEIKFFSLRGLRG